MSFNLATMLREACAESPDSPLLRTGDTMLTYRDVELDAARMAGWFTEQGLARGDRVAIQLPNIPEFVTAYLGALRAGLVTVPLNPLLRPAEVAYQLRDSQASVLVTHAEQLDDATAARSQAELDRLTILATGAAGRAVDTSGVHGLDEVRDAAPVTDIVPTDPLDTAVIIYTSGTTGRPKGAELTHFQLYMNCTVAGEQVHFSSGDVILGSLPMFHVFGLSSVLNSAIRFGASLVLLPSFDPQAALDAAEQHRITLLVGVPTMFIALQQAAGRREFQWPSLRYGISGGAPMPGGTLRNFEEQFPGAVLLEGYGSTESASVVTASRSAEDRRPGSIGRPIWGIDVRVVDEQGSALPPGAEHVGEIQFRGHNVMKGYFGRPEQTAKAIQDGWFATGDLGYHDEDGYFFVVDRKKDMVVRGGYNVYPREVEETLYEHPAVYEAAVFGEPDDRLGEEVVAAITLRPGQSAQPEDIQKFAKERVAPYKYPRHIRILDELPKSASGKILKRSLRS